MWTATKEGPEEGKGGKHADIWEKEHPMTRNSKCKGPEAGVHLACLKSRKTLWVGEIVIERRVTMQYCYSYKYWNHYKVV